MIKQIKLSSQARDQLIRLKSKTGIGNWNVLCRWAFCVSLKEKSVPTPLDIPADSNVEMSWQVFGGEHQELYMALLKQRCLQDGLGVSKSVVSKQGKPRSDIASVRQRNLHAVSKRNTLKALSDNIC